MELFTCSVQILQSQNTHGMYYSCTKCSSFYLHMQLFFCDKVEREPDCSVDERLAPHRMSLSLNLGHVGLLL